LSGHARHWLLEFCPYLLAEKGKTIIEEEGIQLGRGETHDKLAVRLRKHLHKFSQHIADEVTSIPEKKKIDSDLKHFFEANLLGSLILFTARGKSGLSRSDFTARAGISNSTFGNWKGKLEDEGIIKKNTKD